MRFGILISLLLVVVRGQLTTRGLSSPSNRQNAVNDCKCWITWYHRSACPQGRYLKESSCIDAGCCYHDDRQHYRAPKCYQRTGSCPPQECRINPDEREVCRISNRRFIPRHVCENNGCCFNQFAKPNCYKATAAYQPTPYKPQTHPYFAKLDDRNKPHLFHKTERLGPFRFVSSCYVTRNRCGKVGVSRSQCVRFGCCWQSNKDFGIKNPECFRSTRFWLNYPGTFFTMDGASWAHWSQWSQCGGNPCFRGSQTRTRSCTNDYLPHMKCSGPTSETRLCDVPCPGADWGPFVPGACVSPDPACIIGNTIETRVCLLNGFPVPSSNCVGESMRSAKCNTNLCESYGPYTSDTCTVTCGGGIITSTRQCLSPVTSSPPTSCLTKRDPCNEHLCPRLSQWTTWSQCLGLPCSNMGEQTRSRSCLNPGTTGCGEPLTDDQQCSTSCNAEWGEWREGSCDSTDSACLAGIRTNTRICMAGGVTVDDSNCVGSSIETVTCNTHLCSSGFSAYTPGTCSVTCGGGTLTSTRECLDASSSLPQSCLEKVESCNAEACAMWSTWTYTTCSGPSCSAHGTQSRTRECIPPASLGLDGCDGPTTEVLQCSTPCNADWGDWIEGACQSLDEECLAGTRTDTRICLDGGVTVDDSNCVGSNTQTVACNTHLCSSSFSDYTPGTCSLSCGGGTLTSTRVCLGTSTSLPQSCLRKVESCNEESCPFWSAWTPYGTCSGPPCSSDGTQSRTRQCIPSGSVGLDGCEGPISEERECSTPCNADWGDWIEGTCQSMDEECLAGTRTDTRICLDGGVTVDDSNCVGSNTQTVACNTHLCSSSFSGYTPGTCSLSCGGGTMTSTRMCLGTSTSLPQSCLEKIEPCNTEICPTKTDVAFLIDGSTALGESNMDLVLSGISQLVATLDINTGNTRVGALRYDDEAIAQIFPTTSTTMMVQAQILSISFRGGSAFISKAIQFAATRLFDGTQPRKRAVIYAHVPPSDLMALTAAISAANINNVKLFVVALGSTPTTDFALIAGPSNIVSLSNLNNPASVQTQILNFINS